MAKKIFSKILSLDVRYELHWGTLEIANQKFFLKARSRLKGKNRNFRVIFHKNTLDIGQSQRLTKSKQMQWQAVDLGVGSQYDKFYQ